MKRIFCYICVLLIFISCSLNRSAHKFEYKKVYVVFRTEQVSLFFEKDVLLAYLKKHRRESTKCYNEKYVVERINTIESLDSTCMVELKMDGKILPELNNPHDFNVVDAVECMLLRMALNHDILVYSHRKGRFEDGYKVRIRASVQKKHGEANEDCLQFPTYSLYLNDQTFVYQNSIPFDECGKVIK